MSSNSNQQNSNIIGSTEYVEIAGIKNIPAKIDTGADSSAVWASDINMQKDGKLVFFLFDPKSPHYNGKPLEFISYKAKAVRSAHGDTQIRYQVKLPIRIGDKTFETNFTLANRSRNSFPVLIGRHTIDDGDFLVDVSKSTVSRQKKAFTNHLNRELEEDPYKFHQKYIKLKGAK